MVETPNLETLLGWDRTHVWHPFTPHSVYAQESPLMIVSGEGNYLIDAEGNRYLDGVSSIWCNVFGHRKKEIDDAIRDQLDRIAHSTFLGNASAPAVTLARRLVELAPEGLNRVFFSDNGSTAVEVALKMALQYWRQSGISGGSKRTKFLALENAYHGDTVGAVSVGGIDLFHARFGPLLFETHRAPSPYCYRCPLGKNRQSCERECLEEFENTLRAHSEEIAAVVIEPGFQGAGGIIPYPEGYLKKVRDLTAEVGTLLILDEVASGMGRSGKMFVCEREGVVPDFLCIAKGLTGGYLPLAATLSTEKIFEAFRGPPDEGRTFFHGHTYTGNALGAAAALATLDLFESDNVFEKLEPKIELFGERVSSLISLPGVGDVRRYGLAAGIELVADEESKEPFPPSERMGMRVCQAAIRRGVFLRPLGDTIVLAPPLSITEDEIVRLTDVVGEAIAEALSGSSLDIVNASPSRIVLVTGTDTGVGKTIATAGLARALSDRGARIVAIKPVESGCGETVSEVEDGRILATAARQEAPFAALTRLRQPVAPPLAADLEKVPLDMESWKQSILSYAKTHEVVLVEGAGGLLSPLTWKETARELAVDLGAKALVVASDKLGTLNHTLLTLEALDRAGIPVIGVIFSAPDSSDESTGQNMDSLKKVPPTVNVATLPRVRDWEEAAKELEGVSRWILT